MNKKKNLLIVIIVISLVFIFLVGFSIFNRHMLKTNFENDILPFARKNQNTIFKIINVFKEWNNGWYISLEIEDVNNSEEYQKYFLKIPFKNINCENQEILEKIKISQQKIIMMNCFVQNVNVF